MHARLPQTHSRSDAETARRRYWNIVVPLLLIQVAANVEGAWVQPDYCAGPIGTALDPNDAVRARPPPCAHLERRAACVFV